MWTKTNSNLTLHNLNNMLDGPLDPFEKDMLIMNDTLKKHND